MDSEQARAALAALGNGTRLRMIELLAEAGRAGALPSGLAEAVGIPRNLLGAHLLVLEKAGLVTGEKSGRNRICRIEPTVLRALATMIEGYAGRPEA